jgi:hypothetical protein
MRSAPIAQAPGTPECKEPEKGSIIIVLATDAPLDARQLRRLALRAGAGLARTGSVFGHGSGDIVLAFSTAYTVPDRVDRPMPTIAMLHDGLLDGLFQAAADSTEQAILHALWRATAVTGRDGNHRRRFPTCCHRLPFLLSPNRGSHESPDLHRHRRRCGRLPPRAGHARQPRVRTRAPLMAHEANAAIAGAFDAGATEVLVNDSHGGFRNMPPDVLDARARVVQGKPRYLSMVAGVDEGVDAVCMVGYHSRAQGRGILAHTINSFAFAGIRFERAGNWAKPGSTARWPANTARPW